MEKRAARVSGAQWGILIDFLECNPSLVRARGYNNSARGRAESTRLWQEVAALLNAEGSGTAKSAKDWSIYVSNYKSKLKKIVADINTDAMGTGGGPPHAGAISEVDERLLAIMGPGFGRAAPSVSVHPFPDIDLQQPASASSSLPQLNVGTDFQQLIDDGNVLMTIDSGSGSPTSIVAQTVAVAPVGLPPIDAAGPPPLPRQTRRRRYRSRPLAPLDEARRILAQVELQRAAADAALALAVNKIAENIGRLADAAERYISHIT